MERTPANVELAHGMENEDVGEPRRTKCQVSIGVRYSMQRGHRSLSVTKSVINFNTMPDIAFQPGPRFEP